jgi:hypothetical protein
MGRNLYAAGSVPACSRWFDQSILERRCSAPPDGLRPAKGENLQVETLPPTEARGFSAQPRAKAPTNAPTTLVGREAGGPPMHSFCHPHIPIEVTAAIASAHPRPQLYLLNRAALRTGLSGAARIDQHAAATRVLSSSAPRLEERESCYIVNRAGDSSAFKYIDGLALESSTGVTRDRRARELVQIVALVLGDSGGSYRVTRLRFRSEPRFMVTTDECLPTMEPRLLRPACVEEPRRSRPHLTSKLSEASSKPTMPQVQAVTRSASRLSAANPGEGKAYLQGSALVSTMMSSRFLTANIAEPGFLPSPAIWLSPASFASAIVGKDFGSRYRHNSPLTGRGRCSDSVISTLYSMAIPLCGASPPKTCVAPASSDCDRWHTHASGYGRVRLPFAACSGRRSDLLPC